MRFFSPLLNANCCLDKIRMKLFAENQVAVACSGVAGSGVASRRFFQNQLASGRAECNWVCLRREPLMIIIRRGPGLKRARPCGERRSVAPMSAP